ncbi:hypothetical protein GGE43_004071 [Agrobacterium tumefaciens]|uniref:Uncharacterized protein n=1 Tax=Agrobacterium radiobacter TaxID=362 RepID=A0ABR6JCM0_AGRRD|nr:hypothetical protein [Agrobacterium radiobacter]MBB4320476.1 hypothetical protein [Agrobacterium radiobacter]MBB4337141.1 hypothetical protein [Agrobacterium radiobacter]MBB4492611.1 hypothetical protein [Agrobacterium radiobacter]MBB4497509.1 hypothetical protein [Agrobacterium radiobacter]MBB4502580.1 hypothetical protein [Agrobacterium radiobacter]
MPLQSHIVDVCRHLASGLSDRLGSWAIGGSVAAAFHGLDVEPNDIDLFCNADLAVSLPDRGLGTVTTPPALYISNTHRSVRGSIDVNGVVVDIIGDLRSNDGIFCVNAQCMENLYYDCSTLISHDVAIPFMTLDSLQALYGNLGNHQKATDLWGVRVARTAVRHAIGIDVGGVLLQTQAMKSWGNSSVGFLVAYEGALNALQTLIIPQFEENWFVISKAEHEHRNQIKESLEHHGFLDSVGGELGNLIFTDTNAEKAEIARDLRLSHFIDDKWDVLRHMPWLRRLIHFSDAPVSSSGWNVVHAPTWDHVRRIL